MNLLETLKQKILIFDGGTGTFLQERGLKPGELPETWNISHRETVIDLHRAYLEAGCDIVTTNTFGANGLKYSDEGEDSLYNIVTAAVSNAREARRLAGREDDAWVALDLGPTGKLLEPLGPLGFEEACGIYRRVVEIGSTAGADLVLVETMGDTYEMKAAVLAAKEGCRLPVFATAMFDQGGKLLTGGTIPAVVAMLEGLRVDAIGLNCGLGPVQMKELAKEMLAYASVPVIVNPNAGLPRSVDGQTVYDVDSETFAKVMEEMVEMGIRAVGGCCGTTPDHIRRLARACRDRKPMPQSPKNHTLVSSYAQAVEIGKIPVIVGERINPTGKSKFKQALLHHDLDYILNEAVNEQDNGAHILDVNVGLPGIDEPAMMEEAIKNIQQVTELPLQIDTANVEAMERAMRIYNGKPLLNSVNGKKESMEQIFPLVAKYGGVVVGLTLDEEGIPDTAEGRLKVARKIISTAASYGIAAKDILIDGLAMTVSSDSRSAQITLETIKRAKEELGVGTILGVSNISFGLPRRELINQSFFTMALENGLSAGIINPNSAAMRDAYQSFLALSGQDPQCQGYIAAYGGEKKETASAAAKREYSLAESIEKGLKDNAMAQARVQLKGREALAVINEDMIPALGRVGEGFESGRLFLPQLLMSAEAAKAAFEVVREHMEAQGQASRKKGAVIVATVKGDIHDIGKNIAKVLLENYGYRVIDLGKDVNPEVIVAQTVKEKAPLVGLSALMTTTVPSMEETIRLLHEKAPQVKIMVGGAVLTEEYAKSIGADAYLKDAMASVRFAKEVMGE